MSRLPLEGRSLDQRITEAKKLLVNNNYCVYGPLTCKTDVKNARGLVKYFYDALIRYNPGVEMAYNCSGEKDRELAKNFIKSRQATGIKKEVAIVECCDLIDTLFKYEDRLGLSFKITSMGILGQTGKMAWVTNRLVDIINGFNKEIKALEERFWYDNFYKEQEKRIYKELKEANNNAKKEKK